MNVLPTQMVNVADFAATQPAATAPAHVDDIAKFRQSFADAAPTNVVQTEQVAAVPQELSSSIKAVLNQFDSLNSRARSANWPMACAAAAAIWRRARSSI